MVRSWARLQPSLERALSAGVPFPPELVVARFPADAPLIGAVALAIDAAGPQNADVQTAPVPSILSEGLPL
jgi:glucokinase